MVPGSIQVKAGQKVTAGTVLGKMGTSGMSTGVHLHWEIWKGKTHGWTADGKGFVEPVGFVKALIVAQKAKDFANVATPADAPVVENPVYKEEKPVVAAPAKPAVAAVAKPAAKPVAKVYKVKSGDTLSGIATKHKTTVAVLTKLNGIKDASKISVGQAIKLP